VVLLVLLALPAVGLAGWWAVARAGNATAAAAPVEPVVVPVSRQDSRARTSVTVAVGDVGGRELAVAGAGAVTRAPSPGTVGPGDVVLEIDDAPVRAFTAVAPLWRALAEGDRGEDVRRAQVFLTATGHYGGALDGRFGAGVATAVAAFNEDTGLGTGQAVLDPATLVWIGPDPIELVTADAAVGEQVGPGAVVAHGPVRTATVAVTEPQGGIASVGAFGDEVLLTIGEVTVPYRTGSGEVAGEDAVTLRAALAPATEGTADVEASEAVPVAVVPASALVQGADGTVCVYASPGAEPVEVVPVGGGVASAQLPDDVPLTEVLANPGRVVPSVPCGS
jgi:peptidoglycan hydrolase-like protein with peptidoglycan-binding domain